MAAENKGEVPTSQSAHSHRFRFRDDIKNTFKVSCTSSATVFQALETSCEFKDRISKDKRELRIEIQNEGYIVQDFPCKLLEKSELLIISFISNTCREDTNETQILNSKYESEEFILFKINVLGGKNTRKKKFLKDNTLKKELCLYIFAIEGETLKEALQRDGRFLNIVFEKKCHFIDGEDIVEINSNTNLLKGRKFQISLKNEETQKGGELSSDVKTHVVGSLQPSTSIKTEGETNSKSPETRKEEGTERKLSLVNKMQKCFELNHDETLIILQNQLEELVKQMKKRYQKRTYPTLLSHICSEFGKGSSGSLECHRLMKLMKFGGSVCKINAAKQGTGFLLFDRYILTNAHLFQNDATWYTDGQILHCEVTAIFENENTGTDNVPLKIKPDLLDFQCGYDKHERRVDFAILELEDHNLSDNGLLCQYGPQPNSGGVYIIGHPGGKVRTLDPAIVIGYEKREETLLERIGEKIHPLCIINDANGMVSQNINIVTYDTSLFHGASGSPVFDDLCQVIGMHTGGLPYEIDKSYIEYALPLRTILENFLINMTIENKEEILAKFMKQATTCTFLLQPIKDCIGTIGKFAPSCLISALQLWITVIQSEECNTQCPKEFTDLKHSLSSYL